MKHEKSSCHSYSRERRRSPILSIVVAAVNNDVDAARDKDAAGVFLEDPDVRFHDTVDIHQHTH
ncbi:hypothetical protein E4U31_005201 [Claviceps sp. LM219 group G6]|nr:hypothetical protein E4U31_005201 [Claviceps sp. LM219 group G6]